MAWCGDDLQSDWSVRPEPSNGFASRCEYTHRSCVVASISAAVHYWQGNKRTHTNADMPNSLMIIMVLC